MTEVVAELKLDNPEHLKILTLIFEKEKILFKNLIPSDEHYEDEKGELQKSPLPRQTEEQRIETFQRLKPIFPELTENANFQVPQDTIDYTGDVMDLDKEFMAGRYSPYYDITCYVLFEKNREEMIYNGHVWGYSNKSFPGLYGIFAMKSAISNIVNRRNNRTATKLIHHILDKDIKELIVPWPLPSMFKILLELGFKEYNDDQETIEKQFYKNIVTAWHHFVYTK